MLSSVERERYESGPAASRETFLAGRLLLRRLAGELTGEDPGSVDLVAVCDDCGGPHGRPVLRGSDLHLSLSRRDDVIVAAAWHAPIGIDVETPTPSSEALDAIEALAGDATIARWTRVEAVLKADGRGLRVDPSAVMLKRVDGHLEGWVTDAAPRYVVEEIDLAPEITVSVARAL